MVEGGDQPDVPGQQHAVAEHVTGHVPDARHGEVLVLHVDAEGPEVPPDRHPGAAGGDPHGLVVVALRPAGGEGVPEPERVLPGDLVRHVGERRGPLVGGDDEVGVVPVVAHDAVRRHDPAVDQVVGHVEQPPHERAVAGRDLGVQRVPARGWGLHDEPALGADRHDDGVLDGLGLRQPEYLGAEVLRAVRPAQPAAGDRTAPQVHALDARGVDEDLEHGPRQGQVRDAARIELQREPGDPSATGRLEVVGPQRGRHQPQEAAQHPVLVQALDQVDAALDVGDRLLGEETAVGVAVEVGVEPDGEQLDEPARDVRIARRSSRP